MGKMRFNMSKIITKDMEAPNKESEVPLVDNKQINETSKENNITNEDKIDNKDIEKPEEKKQVKLNMRKVEPVKKELNNILVDNTLFNSELDKNKVISLHIATTGLNIDEGHEILKISILNRNGEFLFQSLIHPEVQTEWAGAEKICSITPEMVKDAPNIEDVAKDIISILDNADVVIGHNLAFSEKYIEKFLDYQILPTKKLDLMKKHEKDFPNHRHKVINIIEDYLPEKVNEFNEIANGPDKNVTFNMEVYNRLLRERDERYKEEKHEQQKQEEELIIENKQIEAEREKGKSSNKDLDNQKKMASLEAEIAGIAATVAALTATVKILQETVEKFAPKVEELSNTVELTQEQIKNVAIGCNDISLQLRDVMEQNNIDIIER